MKFPGLTATYALCRAAPRPAGVSAADANVPARFPYRLSYCTAALYATDHYPGHAWLKHCFLRIENLTGEVEYWAIGHDGMVREPNPQTPSTRCRPVAAHLSEQQRYALLSRLEETQILGYSWGDNDCCSALATAHRRAFDSAPPLIINAAARALADSPEIFPPSPVHDV